MELAYTNTSINSMSQPKAKVITVTSGKGGVGKSSTATNLALSLTALDKKVCVFDADASLANINILLGIQPTYTLQHLLNGEKNLKEIIIDGPRGLKVVPGATGIAEYAQLTNEQKLILLAALDKLQQDFDYLIIDTAAGIGDDVLDFIRASQFSIIIITPEPTSLTDSFSLLKVLKRSNYNRTSYILVNMALDAENSQAIYKRFESAVKKYIDVDINYLGYIQVDETMISSIRLQCPAVLLSPDSNASGCFKKLAQELDKEVAEQTVDSFSEFWRQQDGIDSRAQTPSETPVVTFKEDTLPNTVTPPASVKTPLSFKQAADFCIAQLSTGDVTEEDSAAFLEQLAQFQPQVPEEPTTQADQAPSSSSIRELYNYLEQRSFPKDELREIVTTLEQVYFEKHAESLNSFESSSLKLFAQFSGNEDDLHYLNQQLSSCFQREFKKPLYNVLEHLESLVSSNNFSQQSFDDLLSELLSSYQKKFNEAYKTMADENLKSAREEISVLQKQLSDINNELNDTNNTLTEKIMLLNKIQALLPSS